MDNSCTIQDVFEQVMKEEIAHHRKTVYHIRNCKTGVLV